MFTYLIESIINIPLTDNKYLVTFNDEVRISIYKIGGNSSWKENTICTEFRMKAMCLTV